MKNKFQKMIDKYIQFICDENEKNFVLFIE